MTIDRTKLVLLPATLIFATVALEIAVIVSLLTRPVSAKEVGVTVFEPL